jgi:hypothetical protein
MKLFLDGVEVASQTNGPGLAIDNDLTIPFNIGYSNFYSGSQHVIETFDGVMDDIRLWSVARTGADIAANRGTELSGNESGLEGYWKLNGSLDDASPNSNTLVVRDGGTVFTNPSVTVSLDAFLTSAQSARCLCGTEPKIQ